MPWQTCSDRPSTILCRRSEAPALGSLFPSICTALSIASAAAVCLHRNHCQQIPSNQQFNNLPFERFQHVDHPFSDVLASLDDGILPYAPLPRKGKPPSDTGGAPKCRFCASIPSACIRRTSAKAPMLSSQSMSVFLRQFISTRSFPFSCAASASTRARRGRYAAISALAGCPTSTMRV